MAPLCRTQLGLNWYARARQIALELGKGDLSLGAAILAVISPQMPWERNIELALAWSATGHARGLTRDKRRKLKLLAKGIHPWLVLRGMKGRSFYANIIGHEQYVTVDTWMIKYCGVKSYPDTRSVAGRKSYEKCKNRLTREAKMCDTTPRDWQAIVWCHLREA